MFNVSRIFKFFHYILFIFFNRVQISISLKLITPKKGMENQKFVNCGIGGAV